MLDNSAKLKRPIGYFVHHQGRGHAERAAALINALPVDRPVDIFCAKPDIFPPLPSNARIVQIPSLFEPTGQESRWMDDIATPDTVHCAPLGWPSIRQAMAVIASWFHTDNPLVIISDVSAEIAALARLCSVPHIMVLQHGDRSDPGHRAAYVGAAGILAPFHNRLAQPEWDDAMRAKTFFAGGLGVDMAMPGRASALKRVGRDGSKPLALVLSGGGGSGFTQAPIGVAARTFPDMDWVTIGTVQRDWHATEPSNLSHRGWVENPADWIVAADVIVASTGNTTCQQILSAGKPWIAVPEWRYFDEQVEKARALQRAGVALHLPHLPSSAHAWKQAMGAVRTQHDPASMKALCDSTAAPAAAEWVENLIRRLWHDTPTFTNTKEQSHADI